MGLFEQSVRDGARGGEITEPFKSIFAAYSTVDDDEFINSIEAIVDARNEAYKTISQKKKTRRVKPKTKPTKKTAK